MPDVGIRSSYLGYYGLPRRFAPRNDMGKDGAAPAAPSF